jgi:hypothetical protein
MPIKLNKAAKNWYQNKEIIKIQQSEIAFTDTLIEYIASSGAGPCIILILIDKISHQGFMSHIFSSAEISPYSVSGKWLIHICFERYANGLIDIYMVGGYHFISYLLVHCIEEFINSLRTQLNIDTVHRHLYQNWKSDIVFSFKHHEIYNFEVNRDESHPRRLDVTQGLITTFTHLSPFIPLIEYQPDYYNTSIHK